MNNNLNEFFYNKLITKNKNTMAIKYKIWVEIERYDEDKDEYTDEECIGIAYRDTIEDAVELQTLIENTFGEIS